jgi:hypothetical protein
VILIYQKHCIGPTDSQAGRRGEKERALAISLSVTIASSLSDFFLRRGYRPLLIINRITFDDGSLLLRIFLFRR